MSVPHVVVALDVSSVSEARTWVDRLGDDADFYKVGLELYTRSGPDFVRELKEAGKQVFLDLKLHDIPNTVAGAVRSAAELEVDLLTVHAVGGSAMLEAGAEAAKQVASGLRLLAVTVLTSLDSGTLANVWGRSALEVREEVRRLAGIAVTSGIDGAVCSPLEVGDLRATVPSRFLLVTPGIRPAGGALGDQRRVATPTDAVQAGASHLVLGRAVTTASDPVAALAAVKAEVARAAVGAP